MAIILDLGLSTGLNLWLGAGGGGVEQRNATAALTISSTATLVGKAKANAPGTLTISDSASIQAAAKISMTTKGFRSNWQIEEIIKTGATPTWTAWGANIATQIQTTLYPTFDFSGNTPGSGSIGLADIFITVTSPDGWSGLTALDFWGVVGGNSIHTLDVSQATNLVSLATRYNAIKTLDLSNNTLLEILNVRGNYQFGVSAYGAEYEGGGTGLLDISMLPNLTFFQADVTGLTAQDISGNPLLTTFRCYSNQFIAGSTHANAWLAELNANGLSGGTIQINNGATEDPSPAAYADYVALKGKSWTIDVGITMPLAATDTLTFSKSANLLNKIFFYSLTVTPGTGMHNLGISGNGHVDWGDGSALEAFNLNDEPLAHQYNTAGWSGVVTFYGSLTRITTMNQDNLVYWDLADAPATLTNFQNDTEGDVTGDLSELPPNLLYFRADENHLTGQLSDLPSTLTYLYLKGHNTVSGSFNDLPAGLTFFLYNGTLAANGVTGYTQGRTWAANMWFFGFYQNEANKLTTAQIDALLIDFAATTWNSYYKEIFLNDYGSSYVNKRSNASDAAVATLRGQGITVNVKETVFYPAAAAITFGATATIQSSGSVEQRNATAALTILSTATLVGKATANASAALAFSESADLLKFLFSTGLTVNGTETFRLRGVGEIDWGDGSPRTAFNNPSSDVSYTHTYSSFTGTLKLYGSVTRIINSAGSYGTIGNYSFNLNQLWEGLTYFNFDCPNTITGDINDLPASLQYFILYGSNTVTGDIANFKEGFISADVAGLNTFYGNLADLPSTLKWFEIGGGTNTITGDIATLPAAFNGWFVLYGNNTVYGDIGQTPAGLYHFSVGGLNTINQYTGKTWAAQNYFNVQPYSYDNRLSPSEIDQLLIDLDATWTTGGHIYLEDWNDIRTAASDAAVTSLQGKGATLHLNPGIKVLANAPGTLAFSDSAQITGKITASATASLSISDAAVLTGKAKANAPGALTFSDNVILKGKARANAAEAFTFGATASLVGKVYAIPNIISNGTFDTADGWTIDIRDNTIANGSVNNNSFVNRLICYHENLVFKPGKSYRVNFEIKNFIKGGVVATLPNSQWTPVFSGNGFFTFEYRNTEITDKGLEFHGGGDDGNELSLDNVTVNECVLFSDTVTLTGKARANAPGTINFTSTASVSSGNTVEQRDAAASFAFTSTATLIGKATAEATANLAISETATLAGKARSNATDTITFTKTVTAKAMARRNATGTLTFSETVSAKAMARRTAAATVVFTKAASMVAKARAGATSQITFYENAVPIKGMARTGATGSLSITSNTILTGKARASAGGGFQIAETVTILGFARAEAVTDFIFTTAAQTIAKRTAAAAAEIAFFTTSELKAKHRFSVEAAIIFIAEARARKQIQLVACAPQLDYQKTVQTLNYKDEILTAQYKENIYTFAYKTEPETIEYETDPATIKYNQCDG